MKSCGITAVGLVTVFSFSVTTPAWATDIGYVGFDLNTAFLSAFA